LCQNVMQEKSYNFVVGFFVVLSGRRPTDNRRLKIQDPNNWG
jgi:hypothetical protein